MKKPRFQLNEKQLGYVFVLPSLLLVFIVILWPVAQSFWNSMFDYRLNDPTRSERMLSTNIDLETYVDNYYFIQTQLEDLKDTGVSNQDQQTIEEIKNGIEKYHSELISDKQTQEKVSEIDNLLKHYQPVRDSKLKYQKIDKDFSKEYREALFSYQEDLTAIARAIDDDSLQSDIQKTADLLGSSGETILKPNFVGLDNYKEYFKDKRMWESLGNTIIFTVTSVFFELVIGLLVALLINRTFKGRGFIRASVLIPWAVPTAVAAMMWGFLYDGQSGIVAHYLDVLNIIPSSSWLLSTGDGGLVSIILADVWKTTPYMALLILAGLQTIPGSLYEASNVDGASKFQQFFKITLPLLKSSILVALLFRTLDAFRVFDLIYVLTSGGPANSTESISVYAYKTLFAQQNFGEGSTLSVIVFLCVALISFIYVKLIGSELFAGRTK